MDIYTPEAAMEFQDSFITDIREARWMGENRKELRLKIELPEPPRGLQSGSPEVRHVCHYEYTGQTQKARHDNDSYYLVIGRWGPFLETYWLRERPRSKDPNVSAFSHDWHYTEPSRAPTTCPWMSPMTEKGKQDFWIGLWSAPHEAGVEGRYVRIGYSSTKCGNGFTTYIQADYLEYILAQRGIQWKVVPNARQKTVATLEPSELKPYKVRDEVYPNAQTKVTYGARIHWSPDDFARVQDFWLGAYFPSEAEARKAITLFEAEALANPAQPLREIARPLTCANLASLQKMYPDFECPNDLK